MANLTISIPDELRADMDKLVPEPNWSQICRGAIQGYILSQQTDTPRLEVFLDSLTQDIDTEIGPGIRLSLRVENRMPVELLLDRIFLTNVIISGPYIALGQKGWHLAPMRLLPNRSGTASEFLPIVPDDLFRTLDFVTQTLQVRLRVQAFAVGFQNPVHQELRSKIPVDEWKGFVSNVRSRYPWFQGPKEK